MEENKLPEKDNDKDDEISLIDLFSVLLKHKKMIIVTTAVAMVAVFIYCLISLKLPADKSPLPNEYTPKALMLINDSSSSSSSISSMLSSSGLSSLAGIAGVSSGTSYSSLAVYVASTNTFLDAIVDNFNLVEKYKIKKSPRASSRTILKKTLKTEFDSDSGMFSISYTDTDPVFAQSVVDYATNLMEKIFTQLGVDKNVLQKKNIEDNIDASYKQILELEKEIGNKENSVSYGYDPQAASSIVLDTSMLKLELASQQEIYKSLKTQLEALKITMSSETPVFQVFERAEVPDQKSGPSRGKLCIIVTFAAFFISIFLAFLVNAIENIRKDPEAMAKLSNKKRNVV